MIEKKRKPNNRDWVKKIYQQNYSRKQIDYRKEKITSATRRRIISKKIILLRSVKGNLSDNRVLYFLANQLIFFPMKFWKVFFRFLER